MVQVEALRNQLETLLQELARLGPGGDRPAAGAEAADDPAATAPDESAAEHADALHKLSSYLTGAAGETGEALAAHPFVAISAAFMLGVAVGRMSRK